MSPEAEKARKEKVACELCHFRNELREAQKTFEVAKKALEKARASLPLLEALGEPVAGWQQEIGHAHALAAIGESLARCTADDANDNSAKLTHEIINETAVDVPAAKPAIHRHRPF